MSVNSSGRSSFSSIFSSSSFTSSSSASSSSSSSSSSSGARLFCDDCSQILSDHDLTEDTHLKHQFTSLQQAANTQLETLLTNLKHLQSSTKQSGNIKQKISREQTLYNGTYEAVKDAIIRCYSELQDLMEHNQQQLFLLLQAERERQQLALFQISTEGKEHQQCLNTMTEKINALEKRQETDRPGVLLEEIREEFNILETVEEFCSNLDTRMDTDMRMNALENSVAKICQKTKEILPRPWQFSDLITFDQNKKHRDLRVTEDKTHVLLRSSTSRRTRRTPSGPVNVLAAQSFSAGRHYWEVDVSGAESWAVGVAELEWVEQGGMGRPLGSDKRSWVLEREGGELVALHRGELALVGEVQLSRLAVFLDWDKGQLKFLDALSEKLVYIFYTTFSSSIFPAFSITRNCHGKTSRLVICNLLPRPEMDDFRGDEDSVQINSDIVPFSI